MKTLKKSTVYQSVKEYDKLRAEKKKIEERMKVLASEIKNYAQTNGVKDDKGSFYAECKDYSFGSQCKKSISLNDEKVLNYFKADKKLVPYIQTKEFVPEETVELLSADGVIPYENLEKLCTTKTSYSVVVNKKEEVTEDVEEKVVNLPVAASKKPKLKLRKGKK